MDKHVKREFTVTHRQHISDAAINKAHGYGSPGHKAAVRRSSTGRKRPDLTAKLKGKKREFDPSWKANMTEARKAEWANLSPEARAERTANMWRGRRQRALERQLQEIEQGETDVRNSTDETSS